MNSRDDILARVRAHLGRDANNIHAARAGVEVAIDAPVRGPQTRFDRDASALHERFVERSKILASTVDRVATRAEAPAAVRRYLEAHQLGQHAVIWPALADLDWHAAGLDVAARAANGSDVVGITGAWCAVAETGTLLLVSGADTPAATSLLPETHIALVELTTLLPTMEDAFARVRAEFGALPRALNFVSGPSRTADIEQTIVLGAHGPCRVHLVLIDDA